MGRWTATGAFVGIPASMASVWAVTQFLEISWLYNNVVGTVVSCGVGYAFSLLGKAPSEAKLEGLTIETVHQPPDPEEVHKILYWEIFVKQKRKRKIRISLSEPTPVYMPYWIGYLQGRKTDFVAVDATTGKIDLSIKSSLLQGLLAPR